MAAPTDLGLIAPAKLNLFLQVVGKRPDGYHELRSFMAAVSLCDRLRVTAVEVSGSTDIEVECTGTGEIPSGEANLCHRAAAFYLAETGRRARVRIRVDKEIPAGAGLGGGSSDAAATILGLERLLGEPLTADSRTRAAFAVGADVPFFFARSAAWVAGIGEAVRPVTALPPVWAVLVYPGVPVPTKAVFDRYNPGLTTPGAAHTITQFNFPGIVEGLRNDLQRFAIDAEPEVGLALQALGDAGAAARLMSGSGSAVFALCPGRGEAERVARAIGDDPRARRWSVNVVHTLAPGAFPFCD